ncbi:nucleotide disphospho-sugar-binding domain-containing protein [Sphaerisporangium dianthi]|uniref:Nucleotide disphospho-sugar-binding domain-containing protein n=1 Tax=Sphaerisporangium dianthi TaxID=1436120 RepID=A0ABV9CK32_9ACTN
MRILFASWAWPSHFYPMVPLAWAFQSGGHEVRVAGQPGLVPHIVRTGLPAVAVGHDVDGSDIMRRFMTRPAAQGRPLDMSRDGDDRDETGAPRKRRPLALYERMADAMLPDLLDLVRAYRPDLIVHEPTTYAAPLAAAALGVPNARHLWGVDFQYQARRFEQEVFAPHLERLGVGSFAPQGVVTVDPCPGALQIPTEHTPLPVGYLPFNGSGVMPRWLLDPPARRRVCVTWGTTMGAFTAGQSGIAEVLDALGDADLEVVAAVSARDREVLGPVPGNVRLATMLPLHMLLPTCDLMVTQGGSGTVMTAAAAGVPMVVVPQLPDQTLNAQRVAAAGSGVHLPPEAREPADVRVAVEKALGEPALYRAARGISEENRRRPLPAEVAGALCRRVTA